MNDAQATEMKYIIMPLLGDMVRLTIDWLDVKRKRPVDSYKAARYQIEIDAQRLKIVNTIKQLYRGVAIQPHETNTGDEKDVSITALVEVLIDLAKEEEQLCCDKNCFYKQYSLAVNSLKMDSQKAKIIRVIKSGQFVYF